MGGQRLVRPVPKWTKKLDRLPAQGVIISLGKLADQMITKVNASQMSCLV